MPTYIDLAQECFQTALTDPWHSPYHGREFDYHMLSLTLHYARMSLDPKAVYYSRYETDEDAISRSAADWWFYDLSEGDKAALTSAGIDIEDFMRTKYQCDLRACFPYFCDLPDSPTEISKGYYTIPEALNTFKSSLEHVIERNVTLELVAKAHREGWYSDDTMSFENARGYYRWFCENLLGITAINRLGGTESCGVPQATCLRKMKGVDLPRDCSLLDALLEIPPGRWGMVIGISTDQWSAVGIDPLWTKAVLTPGQWKAIALTRYPDFLEKYTVGSSFTIFTA